MPIKIEKNELHLWLADLRVSQIALTKLEKILAADEIERAKRFKFDEHRNFFIAARGILRDILASYLEVAPRAIRFGYSDHGKPELIYPDSLLNFNLSHSSHYALYAILLNNTIGVDIESVRADFAGEDIAQRFFAKEEYDALMNLPNSHRVEGFFNCWTRKEAFIKAIGEGLSFPLKDFIVNLRPDQPAALIELKGSRELAKQWHFYSFIPAENYVAAVATQADIKQIKNTIWRKSD